MHVKKPDPLPTGSDKPPRVCSVCGSVSYSMGGIHPQCAEVQADAKRVAKIKRENKARKQPATADKSQGSKAWHKACPKCKAQVHVRKRTCECGYRFS